MSISGIPYSTFAVDLEVAFDPDPARYFQLARLLFTPSTMIVGPSTAVLAVST